MDLGIQSGHLGLALFPFLSLSLAFGPALGVDLRGQFRDRATAPGIRGPRGR
jgi:hypothetical protein